LSISATERFPSGETAGAEAGTTGVAGAAGAGVGAAGAAAAGAGAAAAGAPPAGALFKFFNNAINSLVSLLLLLSTSSNISFNISVPSMRASEIGFVRDNLPSRKESKRLSIVWVKVPMPVKPKKPAEPFMV